ncbi:MAG: signal recognition particle receptor subunit alpha, partial [Haloechinothrix sp.]
MSSNLWFWIIVVVVVVLTIALVAGLTIARRRKISLAEAEQVEEGDAPPRGGGYSAGGGIALAPGGPMDGAPDVPSSPPVHPVQERTEVDGQPGVGDDASVPRDAPRRGIVDVRLPTEDVSEAERIAEVPEPELTAGPAPVVVPEQSAPAPVEEIEPTTGRIERLRGRLAKSRSALGQSLLGLLGAGDLDEDSWEEVEDTLLVADLGTATTTEIVTNLRAELSARGVRTAEQARAVLREVLIGALHPEFDRSVRALPHAAPGGGK